MPTPRLLSEIRGVIEICDEPRLVRLPLELRAGARARCRDVHACEHREPAKVLGRLFGGLCDDGNAQTAADYFGDRFERHALLSKGMEGMEVAALRGALKREPINASGVEAVHGRPAVEPIADIGGHAPLARELDEPRNEAVIAVPMHGG